MRLNHDQIQIIKQTVELSLGKDASVRLFGSRLDDKAKGGDVDLHISLARPVASTVVATSQLAARLERKLDGRKVDVRLWTPDQEMMPVDLVALRTGISL
jgi:predicted nucleotidyltransferase